MHRISNPIRTTIVLSILTAIASPSAAFARDGRDQAPRGVAGAKLWHDVVDQVTHGDFDGATATLQRVSGHTSLTDKVLAWLKEFEAKEAARRRMDAADLEKYVRYAKERMERKEYALALDHVFRAADVSPDRAAFLASDWLKGLVSDALEKAASLRKNHKWREAWRIYNDLQELYTKEARYEKLTREVQTLWRLDTMFEDDNPWEEQIEKIRWEDGRAALEHIERRYVNPDAVDFRLMCQDGLEQLLLLAESDSAQKEFKGLGNADDRRDFEDRIRERIARVRNAPRVSRRDCAAHFDRAIRKINNDTVKLPEALLVSEVMRGALEPLDDYTTLIWPSNADEFDKHTRGDFIGVGISIRKQRATDEIEVVTPLEDSPAYRAGIQAGDIITHVNGKPLKGFTINRVVKTITGPIGTEVDLTIRRGEDPIDFPLVRDKIEIVSVKGLHRRPNDPERWEHWLDSENGVAYVRLTSFQKNTPEALLNLLSELEAKGLEGLVLDLRGNPGGLLNSAWEVSRLFLHAHNVVVSTEGRDAKENQRFTTPGEGPYADVPLVVLVDESSASASEIVSGAIRDNQRGTVVGARTFGKFSVQNLVSLNRGQAKLKITTAKWVLPSGISLHRFKGADTWGVEPDLPIRLVLKEKRKLFQMRRDAQILGPKKKESKDEDDDKAGDEDAEGKDGDEDEAVVANAEEEADKLPPIEQPDDNDRPDADPQLDAALLYMRIKLLDATNPIVADAETGTNKEVRQP